MFGADFPDRCAGQFRSRVPHLGGLGPEGLFITPKGKRETTGIVEPPVDYRLHDLMARSDKRGQFLAQRGDDALQSGEYQSALY